MYIIIYSYNVILMYITVAQTLTEHSHVIYYIQMYEVFYI